MVTFAFVTTVFLFSDMFAALKPGNVQDLRSTLNPNEASLTLNWDLPNNVISAGEVTAYDIRFKVSGGGNNYYSVMTVNAPARSIHLSRESGLNPLTKYTLEVRARNFHCQGEWNCISEYIGMCMYVHAVLDMTVNWYDTERNYRYSVYFLEVYIILSPR